VPTEQQNYSIPSLPFQETSRSRFVLLDQLEDFVGSGAPDFVVTQRFGVDDHERLPWLEFWGNCGVPSLSRANCGLEE
jgi:hypothetical protein